MIIIKRLTNSNPCFLRFLCQFLCRACSLQEQRCGILLLLGLWSRIIDQELSHKFKQLHWSQISRWCLVSPGQSILLLSPTYRETLARKAISIVSTASLLALPLKNQGYLCSILGVSFNLLGTVRVLRKF